MKEQDPEEKFEDQNFSPATYVTLARIYDLLAVIALVANPVAAQKVLNLHEAGKLYGSDPYLVFTKPDDDHV